MHYAGSVPRPSPYCLAVLIGFPPKSYKIFPPYATKQHRAPFIIFTKLLELIL